MITMKQLAQIGADRPDWLVECVKFDPFDIGNFKQFGKKTLLRVPIDYDPFFKDLQELVNVSGDHIDARNLYKKHPTIRLGLRRAILILRKRKKNKNES